MKKVITFVLLLFVLISFSAYALELVIKTPCPQDAFVVGEKCTDKSQIVPKVPPSAPTGVTIQGGGQPTSKYNLVIRKSGDGTGTVTSSPPGINCGSTCSATYNIGMEVTLTATPDPGSSLFGRASHCFPEYTRECKVTVNTDKVIEIVFMQLVPVDTDSGICPIGYDCRSGNHERSFICSFNGDIDCYTPTCISMRNCARTARDCVAMRNAGVNRNPDTDPLRLYFSYLCEY